MAGLFTLDSASLGVLDADVLGGLGTGFVVGTSTSTGQVAGVQGFTGSATGSSTTTGTALGAVAFVGSATGSSATTGTAVGSVSLVGNVDGENVNNGGGNGSPALVGSVIGSSVSTGSVSGQPDGPPPPAPPDPEVATGHAPFFRYVQPRPPKPQQLQPTRHTGGAQGRTRTTAKVAGGLGYGGTVKGSQATTGTLSGVRFPSDELVARWARQLTEHELLTLELL